MPLSERGFLNVSVEYAANEGLSRGVQRPNAQALIDAGVPGVGQDSPFDDAPLVQTWGRAQGDNLRMFFNAGIDIDDDTSVYAQSNYADTFGRYRFFYRDPNHITLRTLREEHGFNGLPGGFTPYFDGDQEDLSLVGGIRGSFGNGVLYDFSAGYGYNEIDFVLNNTINQSLGLGADGKPGATGFRRRRSATGGSQPERRLLQTAFGCRSPGVRSRVAGGDVHGHRRRAVLVCRRREQRLQGFRAAECRRFFP